MLWKNSLEVSYEVKHTLTCSHSNALRYLPKTNENICLHKDLYLNVNSSFIYNSPKLETTQCPLADNWINRLWYIHTNRTLLTNKKV